MPVGKFRFRHGESVGDIRAAYLPVYNLTLLFRVYGAHKYVLHDGKCEVGCECVCDEARLIVTALPFSAVGAIWLLYLLGYNMSIGVWVGLIALMGVDAETGVFMMLYLDLAYEEQRAQGRMKTWEHLREAILHGAVKRVRPKFMTVAVMFMGLLPIMWSAGAGSDVMKRIAAPMVGGIFTSFIMELLVYPAIYAIWRGREFRREA